MEPGEIKIKAASDSAHGKGSPRMLTSQHLTPRVIRLLLRSWPLAMNTVPLWGRRAEGTRRREGWTYHLSLFGQLCLNSPLADPTS